MQVAQIMSSPAVSVAADTTVREAAALFRRHGIGMLPVMGAGRPVGVVTERDIVTAILPDHPEAGAQPVGAAMTPDPVYCSTDSPVADAAALIGDEQVRRLLVQNPRGGLVRIVSVGDIAEYASEELAGQALGEICEVRRADTPVTSSE